MGLGDRSGTEKGEDGDCGTKRALDGALLKDRKVEEGAARDARAAALVMRTKKTRIPLKLEVL